MQFLLEVLHDSIAEDDLKGFFRICYALHRIDLSICLQFEDTSISSWWRSAWEVDGTFWIYVDDIELAGEIGVGDGYFDDLKVVDVWFGSDFEGIFEGVLGINDALLF